MRSRLAVDTFVFILDESTPAPGALISITDRPNDAWCTMAEICGGTPFQMVHISEVPPGTKVMKLEEVSLALEVKSEQAQDVEASRSDTVRSSESAPGADPADAQEGQDEEHK